MAPLLNSLTDGGIIDYRQQLDEVIDEEFVIEGLVTVLELLQEDVAINIAAQSLKLAVTALGLLLQGFDGRRKASDHANRSARVKAVPRFVIGLVMGSGFRDTAISRWWLLFSHYREDLSVLKRQMRTHPREGVSKVTASMPGWPFGLAKLKVIPSTSSGIVSPSQSSTR